MGTPAAVALLLMLAGVLDAVEVDDAVMKNVVDRLDRLERRNGELERRNQELERKVLTLGQTPKKRFLMASDGIVAFTARINPLYIDHVTPHQTIIFEHDVTNIGGGYNNNTGVFVAPVSGLYMFSCSLLDHSARSDGSGVMLHAEIVKDHTVLGRVFAHAEDTSYRDQGAQTVFASVQKGDQVWVRSIDNQDLSVGGEMYSTFSGCLLYETEYTNVIVSLRDQAPKKRFLVESDGIVAFTARIDPLFIDHVNPHQTIIFEHDVTNIGGGYNNNTGVFVAPVSGLYTFSCSLLDHSARGDGSGVMLHAEIVKDHTVLARVFAHAESTSYRDQGAQTVYVSMRKGEQVWVRSIDNPDLTVGGEMYSTFSGCLLYEMEYK